jgi:hypothetical protein
MNTYYLTFGQQYPWRNGWVEVEAPDFETARRWVENIFGFNWSDLKKEDEFDKSYYPAGKLGETIK